MAGKMATALLAGLLLVSAAHADSSRKLLQTPATTVSLGSPATITVSAANPLVNAITITLARPYPQNGFYCNVTGDSRIPTQGVFPLTVRVPVGVTSTVVFANITGPIPGTSCTMGSSSVVQQGATVVQQQGGPTSIVQQQQTANSVVQQQGSSTVVQQQYATSVNQQVPNMPAMNCVANSSSVVQQQGPPSSVVQQSTPATVVQQQATPRPATVVQQQPATVVQQQPATVVQQPATPAATPAVTTPRATAAPVTPAPTTRAPATPAPTTVAPATPAPTTVAPATPAPTARATSAPVTVVQQQAPPVTVVQQQSPPSTVVQQQGPPSSVVQQTGRHLLQVGTIEYISNNGSTGQPQLSVLDTVEGVPNISFKPTAAGQTATFNGGLQVAVTTTNNGFGTPYIPYRVDSRLSPQCGVQVNFVAI